MNATSWDFEADFPFITGRLATKILREHGQTWEDFVRDIATYPSMYTPVSADDRVETRTLLIWLGY